MAPRATARCKRGRARLGAIALLAALGLLASAVPAQGSIPDNQKRVCVYDVNSISGLNAFAAMVGRKVVDCAMVYTGATTWDQWVDPWFLHHSSPDLDWSQWVAASPVDDRRQLIISQPLIPSDLASTDWRTLGAAGTYDGYAVQLASNLVSAGLGDAIIRLSWEMNGTWNVDNIGDTPQQWTQWAAFWRQMVLAMRSVPGAHFQFVWCINNRVRNIPFSSYYPGDDVVDIIGDDVYDSGVPAGQNRWAAVAGSPGGLDDLVSFAQQHQKPLALPEWGVGVPNSSNLAGGDDPAYVNGIATVVRDNDVAFQSYFYAHEWATELQDGPASLAAYRAHFGDGGDAVGSGVGTAAVSNSSAGAATPSATHAPVVNSAPPAAGSPAPSSANRKGVLIKAGRTRKHRTSKRRGRHRRTLAPRGSRPHPSSNLAAALATLVAALGL